MPILVSRTKARGIPRFEQSGCRIYATTGLLQGLGVYGRSGAGKTNVVFGLIQQLERREIPFLFLDWKQTCRHLLPLLKRPVNFYTPGRSLSPLAFNPLVPPPGLEVRVHIAQVIDIMGAAYTLGDGAKSLVQKALRAAYEEAIEWPTLSEVQLALEALPATGRASGWKASASRALESLTYSSAVEGDTSDQESLVQRLLETSTIIELDGLIGGSKKFLVPALMMWLFRSRLHAPDRETLRLVVIIEEAHHLLYRSENRAEESVMNRVLRQCRELGISIVVVDQHAHLISSAALGNTHTNVCLSQGDPTDINKASALLGLADTDKKLLQILPVGSGIVKMQDRWPWPFLVEFPKVDVLKGLVTDEILREHLKQGPMLSLGELKVKAVSAGTHDPSIPDLGIGSPAFKLLLDCYGFPTDGIQARYKRLGMSMDSGNRLKNRLLAGELAEGALIQVGRTRRFIMRPTKRAKGITLLDPAPSPGSVEHEFWKHFYFQRLKKEGWDVEMEAARVGGRVDVLATKGEERIGIEIETGKSDVVKNVRACLRSGYSQVVVVATSGRARRKVERQLRESSLDGEKGVSVVEQDGAVTNRAVRGRLGTALT